MGLLFLHNAQLIKWLIIILTYFILKPQCHHTRFQALPSAALLPFEALQLWEPSGFFLFRCSTLLWLALGPCFARNCLMRSNAMPSSAFFCSIRLDEQNKILKRGMNYLQKLRWIRLSYIAGLIYIYIYIINIGTYTQYLNNIFLYLSIFFNQQIMLNEH